MGAGGGGGASTVTVTDWLVVPPEPPQTSVNVLFAANGVLVSLPDVGLLPVHVPKASQLSALLDDHVSVVVSLRPTLVGLAARETVGGGGGGRLPTVTVTASVVIPLRPWQVSV